MKKSKFKSTKFLKNFELGQNQLATLLGGNEAPTQACNYHENGNDACSQSCPDSTIDYNGN